MPETRRGRTERSLRALCRQRGTSGVPVYDVTEMLELRDERIAELLAWQMAVIREGMAARRAQRNSVER